MTKEEYIKFVDKVNHDKEEKQRLESIQESPDIKYRKLNAMYERAQEEYLKSILFNIYEKALPLNDDYKNAYMDDLKEYFGNFLDRVTEGNIVSFTTKSSRKSPFAKNALEMVDCLAKEQYSVLGSNIKNIKNADIKFEDADSDDMQQEIDIKVKDLNGDEVAEIIKNNVKKTALHEINKAKEEKEKIKEFEKELMNDINIDSEEKIEEAVNKRFNNKSEKTYIPSLFEAVIVKKYSQQEQSIENGTFVESSTYDTMNTSFGKTVNDKIDYAFIESVKEYTGLSLLHATKIMPIDKRNIDSLRFKYQ